MHDYALEWDEKTGAPRYVATKQPPDDPVPVRTDAFTTTDAYARLHLHLQRPGPLQRIVQQPPAFSFNHLSPSSGQHTPAYRASQAEALLDAVHTAEEANALRLAFNGVMQDFFACTSAEPPFTLHVHDLHDKQHEVHWLTWDTLISNVQAKVEMQLQLRGDFHLKSGRLPLRRVGNGGPQHRLTLQDYRVRVEANAYHVTVCSGGLMGGMQGVDVPTAARAQSSASPARASASPSSTAPAPPGGAELSPSSAERRRAQLADYSYCCNLLHSLTHHVGSDFQTALQRATKANDQQILAFIRRLEELAVYPAPSVPEPLADTAADTRPATAVNDVQQRRPVPVHSRLLQAVWDVSLFLQVMQLVGQQLNLLGRGWMLVSHLLHLTGVATVQASSAQQANEQIRSLEALSTEVTALSGAHSLEAERAESDEAVTAYLTEVTERLARLLRRLELSREALKRLDADIKRVVEGSSWWRWAVGAAVAASAAAGVVLFAPVALPALAVVGAVGGAALAVEAVAGAAVALGVAYAVLVKVRQLLEAVRDELRHGTLAAISLSQLSLHRLGLNAPALREAEELQRELGRIIETDAANNRQLDELLQRMMQQQRRQ